MDYTTQASVPFLAEPKPKADASTGKQENKSQVQPEF
jgi:hypothetical protein